MSTKYKSVPKRSIKAYFNAALWGNYDLVVHFLRGTDYFAVEVLDREEVERLTLAPKSNWSDVGMPVDTQLYEFQAATALMIGAANGHLRIVSLLLELGADSKFRDRRGRHSLMWAAQTGQLHVISFLLDWQAESLILTPRTLQRRIVRGDGGATLTADGKEPTWADSPRSFEKRKEAYPMKSPLKSFLQSPLKSPREMTKDQMPGSPNLPSLPGINTNLSIKLPALTMKTPPKNKRRRRNKKNKLQSRLKKFINIKDENGWTSLLLALRAGHVEVANELIDRGGNINDRTFHGGDTALMLAAAARTPTVVKRLLSLGLHVDAVDVRGWTALRIAVQCNDAESTKILVKAGADPDVVDAYGESCLTLAASMGNVDVLLLLLKRSHELWAKEAEKKLRQRQLKEDKINRGILKLATKKVVICTGGRRQWLWSQHPNKKHRTRSRITVIYTVSVVTTTTSMEDKKEKNTGDQSESMDTVEIVVSAKYGNALEQDSAERRFSPKQCAAMGLSTLLLSMEIHEEDKEDDEEEGKTKQRKRAAAEAAAAAAAADTSSEEDMSEEDVSEEEGKGEKEGEKEREGTTPSSSLSASSASSSVVAKIQKRKKTQYELDAEYQMKMWSKRAQATLNERRRRRKFKIQEAGLSLIRRVEIKVAKGGSPLSHRW